MSTPNKKRRNEQDIKIKSSSGVDYTKVHDRHIEDDRFKRQRKIREQQEGDGKNEIKKTNAPSATMDALLRMVHGKEERTIADKLADPNRITWEQYKKDNKDKLSIGKDGEKEMASYRKELDKAREKALAKRNKPSKKTAAISSSDDSSEDDSKQKKKKKSSKKSKKKKKRKYDSSDSDKEEDSNKRKKSFKKKKKKKKSSSLEDKESSPVRLSSFFQQDGSSSED